jgi:hypothetical protein
MSTLVNIVMALVLNLMSTGGLHHQAQDISKVEKTPCCYNIENLRSHYIIKKDELVFQLK